MKNEELRIKKEEFCIENDEFCRKLDVSGGGVNANFSLNFLLKMQNEWRISPEKR